MPKEMQSAYQRWEMNSFGDERPSVVAKRALEAAPPPAPMVALPTAEDVAAIYDQARREGYEEGRAQGHADGYTDGMAIGRTESEAELAHLKAVAAAFGQAVAQADETIASDVLDLALHLARSMLRTAFDVKPELVIPVVREAIEYLPVLQQPALLVLHPADAQLVRGALGEELDKGGWRVIEDAQVGRGGCKVDTATNQIDAQAAARWQRLSHALGKNVEWLGA
jgi:flagellar assembly protein FliH